MNDPLNARAPFRNSLPLTERFTERLCALRCASGQTKQPAVPYLQTSTDLLLPRLLPAVPLCHCERLSQLTDSVMQSSMSDHTNDFLLSRKCVAKVTSECPGPEELSPGPSAPTMKGLITCHPKNTSRGSVGGGELSSCSLLWSFRGLQLCGQVPKRSALSLLG